MAEVAAAVSSALAPLPPQRCETRASCLEMTSALACDLGKREMMMPKQHHLGLLGCCSHHWSVQTCLCLQRMR